MMKSTRRATLLLGVCVLLLLSLPAGADTITYVLTQSNLGGGFPGPFASVAIGWNGNNPSNTATVTFNSMVAGQYIYLMGGQGAVALNVDVPWTIGSITGSNSHPGFTPGPYTQGPAGNEDGFGNFDLTVDSFDGFTHSATQITFTLTNTGGTWADAASVLKPNTNGQIAAIHAFACIDSPDPCTTSNLTVVTGYAAGAVVVPEPASLFLLGSGLLGGVLRRRNRSGTQ